VQRSLQAEEENNLLRTRTSETRVSALPRLHQVLPSQAYRQETGLELEAGFEFLMSGKCGSCGKERGRMTPGTLMAGVLVTPLPDLSRLRPETAAKVRDIDRQYREAVLGVFQWMLHAESLLRSMMSILQEERAHEKLLGTSADDDPWKDEPN
jgi:hypothetical protein